MNDKLQVDENTLRTMQELLRVGSGILERDKLAPAGQRDRIVEGTGLHAAFPSGCLISWNVATWILSIQDSSTAPQTLQDA